MTKNVDFHEVYKNISVEPLDGEVFKVLAGCNGVYQVSNFGRILKMPNKKRSIPIIKKHHKSVKGYHYTSITDENGISRNEMVHRLVAKVFHDNPDDLPCVNHKDGVKSNLCEWNLEWCTVRHNMQHAWRTGLIVPIRGENHYKAKLSLEKVVEIRRLFENTKMKGVEIAKMFGISANAVSSIKVGRNWKIE
jgi:NUMOD4 motif